MTGLYATLDWLWKEGLVTKDERETTLRPGRRVRYRLSEKGTVALEEWMTGEPEPEELRSGLVARIAVAEPEDVPALLAHLDEAERACLAQAADAADRTPGGSTSASASSNVASRSTSDTDRRRSCGSCASSAWSGSSNREARTSGSRRSRRPRATPTSRISRVRAAGSPG
jgi:DNA-binding MarR family transcriptional regulator